MRKHTRTKGQALVEFALSATLIFFMLAAAVDLGLIFFTLQGLHNAAQEGATYGSRWLVSQDPNDNTSEQVLDVNGIQDRVRHEAGDKGGIGFVNLLDLNNDEVTDNDAVIDNYIQVTALNDTNGDGDPLPENMACPSVTDGRYRCYIRVVVSIEYDMVFPLAPVFGNRVRLTSSYLTPMRTGFFQTG